MCYRNTQNPPKREEARADTRTRRKNAMARVKLGGLAQDVRGTLNGNVFSRNRGGAYVRTKVSPVQPVSAFSSLARSIFAALSQAWSTDLSDVERAAWEAFAAVHPFVIVFGDAIVLSGIAFYQSVN